MDVDQIEEGEWIADGVLAHLGTEPGFFSGGTNNPKAGGGLSVRGPEEAGLPFSSTEPLKALHSPVHPTLDHSHRARPPLPRRFLPDRMPTVRYADLDSRPGSRGIQSKSRPMTLPQRPVSPRYIADRDRSASFVNNLGPARRPAQERRFRTREMAKTIARGPLSSRTNVQSTHFMGDVRDKAIQVAPSQPRAMQMLPPVKIEKVENNRLTGGIGSELRRPASTVLSHTDLQKWPCRRCLFVHKGGECEINCIGCGSMNPDEHSEKCPFRNRIRVDEYPPLKRAYTGQQKIRTGSRAIDPRVSATMQLSYECQRLGFNPEFQYFQGVKDGHFTASLSIKDTVITCGERSFATQKDARDALAPKGLEIVRKMAQNLSPVGGRTKDEVLPKAQSPELNRKMLSDNGSNSSMVANFPAPQPERHDIARDKRDSIMDLIRSEQTAQQWGNSLANRRVSSTSNTFNNVALSEQGAGKRTVIVELPGNIESSTVKAAVEGAVAANPHRNISLHFPANVSVEIARAYGSAISSIATSSRHRSRSRSPKREVQQVIRVRSGDRDHPYRRERAQDHGQYHQPASSSIRPPRRMTDTYRPSLETGERRRSEDFRPRLSPALESKHYRSYDRREYGPRDRPARN